MIWWADSVVSWWRWSQAPFVEGRLDEIGGELLLSSGADFRGYIAPHVRREHNIPQGLLATDTFQPPKAPGIGPSPALVRDPMEVDDPSKLHLPPIPEMHVSCIQREVGMAYTISRNAEILLRTLASLVTVSLNPGVSTRITGCPSTRNCGETCISEVQG
jgi:hypothetical protein